MASFMDFPLTIINAKLWIKKYFHCFLKRNTAINFFQKKVKLPSSPGRPGYPLMPAGPGSPGTPGRTWSTGPWNCNTTLRSWVRRLFLGIIEIFSPVSGNSRWRAIDCFGILDTCRSLVAHIARWPIPSRLTRQPGLTRCSQLALRPG